MVITWYGLSCFKITSGNLTLVTDPFSKNIGLTPPRVRAEIAIISNLQNPNYNNRQPLGGEKVFVIDSPGEFDVKGLFVRGIPAQGHATNKSQDFDYTTIYSIWLENIRLGFLGSLKQKELSQVQLESLGEVDILFIPTGGKTVCQAEEAVTIVNQVEPKIILPSHYAQAGLRLVLDQVELFLKEIGSPKKEPQEKLTIKKSNLLENSENPEVLVLAPQR